MRPTETCQVYERRDVEAVRVEPSAAEPSDAASDPAPAAAFTPPLPVEPIFMDLGEERLQNVPDNENGKRFMAELTKLLEQLSRFTAP